jgi:hypothetical protein
MTPREYERTAVTGIPSQLRLIRFGGHLPKGGYDVQNDGRASEDAPATPAV